MPRAPRELWSEVHSANRDLTPAWRGAAQTYRQPRPLPRQMRPAAQRAYDANPGVRAQALSQMQREQGFQQRAYADTMYNELGRNEVNTPSNAYLGQDVLELTGAPALARGFDRIAEGRPGAAIPEVAMGGLGIAGTAFGGGFSPSRLPRARLPASAESAGRLPINPTRMPARASDGSVLPRREPELFRRSLQGGSDDLRSAAGGGIDGFRMSPDEVMRAHSNTTEATRVAEWVRRLDAGEYPTTIAREVGLPPWQIREAADLFRRRGSSNADDLLRNAPDGGAAQAGNRQALNWLGNDRLIRNPTDADLTRLAELGDEIKYVMDTDGNVYAFSAADAHHNNAMRALRDHGVSVRSLGPGAEVTDPDAAGFIWRNNDGTFSHEDANMRQTGSYGEFAQRIRPSASNARQAKGR